MLRFYCHSTQDVLNPFSAPTEVLLSVSIIRDDCAFSPIGQSGEGFMEMVQAIVSNPSIKKLTLLNTAFLQRHRKVVLLAASGAPVSSETEVRAEELAIRDGEDWLRENREAIDLLSAHFKDRFRLLDLRAVLSSPGFGHRLQEIEDYYYGRRSGGDCPIKISKLKSGLESLIDSFTNSLDKRITQQSESGAIDRRIVKRCMGRIAIEECVARTFMEYPYEIYRGVFPPVGELIFDAYGKRGMMRSVCIGDDVAIAKAMKLNPPKKLKSASGTDPSPSTYSPIFFQKPAIKRSLSLEEMSKLFFFGGNVTIMMEDKCSIILEKPSVLEVHKAIECAHSFSASSSVVHSF